MLRLHAGSCAVLVGLLFLAVEAATVTVSAETAGTTPDVVGYNTGHFVPGSNTADWWDYAGVNGARFFISPARIEPVGDDDADPWGDGVGNRDGFIARRAALRADPAAYNNFEYYRSRLESVTLAGSRVRVAYAFEELTRLGVGMVAMIGRTVARYPFDDGNPWADRWEHWQHYYAMAYVLASDYGVVRYQMYNEPNHSSNANLSQGHYVTRLRFASDAVQSAIADVNLKGVLLGTEIAVPLLSEDGGGVIVNSGSQPRPRRERLRGDKGRGRLLHQGVCRPQRDPRNQGELCLSGHDQHTDDRQDRLRREAGRMAGARHGSDGDDPAGRDR